MRARWIAVVVVVVVVVALVVQWVRPVPALAMRSDIGASVVAPGGVPKISWPSQGEAAIAVSGVGLIGQSGAQTPTPIASVTKIMSAYLILRKHPLTIGQNGPMFTITPADVQIYLHDKATDQSLLPVQVGEKLTELQLLEAMLLPSANNIAHLLATWTDGSQRAFVVQMNQTAKAMGMTHTHYVDASGVDSGSASTAVDQLKIVEAAMKIPVFREVVAMPQATLPLVGTVYNVNGEVGKHGIVGVKTGTTSQAGGCFVFATEPKVDGKSVRLLGVVLDQQGTPQYQDSMLTAALDQGVLLSKQAALQLRELRVIAPGAVVATLHVPWATSVPCAVDQGVSLLAWPGRQVAMHFQPAPIGNRISANSRVGTLTLTAGTQTQSLPVYATSAIEPPSTVWRLQRNPFAHWF